MKWTVDKIVEWHQMAMPNATFDKQTLKVEDELQELMEAASLYVDAIGPQEDAVEEMADVYISSLVLAKRFNSAIGVLVYNFVVDSLERLVSMGTEPALRLHAKMLKAIDEKMDKNVRREWEETAPGYYQHKENKDTSVN